MEAQKVCIIGDGLTGLVTAITLSRLNLKIDLFTSNYNKKIKTNRKTAISNENYNFLKKMKIFKFPKKEFWPCINMRLYSSNKNEKFHEILEFNNDKNKEKKLLYMIDNSVFINNLIKSLKKSNSVEFKNNYKVNKIIDSGPLKIIKTNKKYSSKYNLVIVCVGTNSDLEKKVFKNNALEYSYKEVSVTTILKHHYLKNNVARQIFFDDEILALLPVSNTTTSIVWSLKKELFFKYKKNLLLKKKIKLYTNNFLKNIKFISKLEFKDLNLIIKKKYFENRILLFGDSIHVVHPFAGQGFNMILRDLMCLEEILKNKINLGLDIGSDDILSTLSNEIKSQNFAYSLGIDFLKKGFSFKNKSLKNIRNKTLVLLNKNNLLKDLFFNAADKGLKF